jgi:RNA polymerase sigma-70 factor (ECF subfamily)
MLRDIDGLSADEVCTVLGVSAGNQRVLLHRARSRVRAAVERHLTGQVTA